MNEITFQHVQIIHFKTAAIVREAVSPDFMKLETQDIISRKVNEYVNKVE